MNDRTHTHDNPSWWTQEHDSSWDRVKEAFRRDWEQTKHDFGADDARDLDQDAGDTAAQASGKRPIPEDRARTFESLESDYRYGYGARQHYGAYDEWNEEVETRLRKDWGAEPGDWAEHRDRVRRGFEYGAPAERKPRN